MVPRGQQGAKNPLVREYVRMYVPPAFRNHKSQSYEIRNLSSIYARKGHSKLLVEIGKPEVVIYTKDLFFFLFSQKRTI